MMVLMRRPCRFLWHLVTVDDVELQLLVMICFCTSGQIGPKLRRGRKMLFSRKVAPFSAALSMSMRSRNENW